MSFWCPKKMLAKDGVFFGQKIMPNLLAPEKMAGSRKEAGSSSNHQLCRGKLAGFVSGSRVVSKLSSDHFTFVSWVKNRDEILSSHIRMKHPITLT